MKTCTKCRVSKPLSEFTADGGNRRSQCKLCCKAHRDAAKDRKRQTDAARYTEKSAELRAWAAQYRKRNREKVNAYDARRDEEKRKATPSWANQFFIKEAYSLAKKRSAATGFLWHVDHIVPLKSPIVCGLHVEFNLQVIPARENLRKRNFHDTSPRLALV